MTQTSMGTRIVHPSPIQPLITHINNQKLFLPLIHFTGVDLAFKICRPFDIRTLFIQYGGSEAQIYMRIPWK